MQTNVVNGEWKKNVQKRNELLVNLLFIVIVQTKYECRKQGIVLKPI